jgi:hypothetical protein
MTRNAAATERLRNLISKIRELTSTNALRWERQAGSAHRYARWNNNLLILGPSAHDADMPRYLFITPFDSPDCIEINSQDADLGAAIVELANEVERITRNAPPNDPFALNTDLLDRLMS